MILQIGNHDIELSGMHFLSLAFDEADVVNTPEYSISKTENGIVFESDTQSVLISQEDYENVYHAAVSEVTS